MSVVQDGIEAVGGNEGIIVLAPPYPSKMADLVDTVITVVGNKKKVLVCESYSRSDKPVDTMNAAFMVRARCNHNNQCLVLILSLMRCLI